MQILIVDDEPAAIERLEVLLGQISDIEVVGSATDGTSALRAIETLRPDLVLLDIQMPDISGLAVASQVAGGPERPEIVFVTAFEMFAADAFEVEAVDYLLKPVRFERLRQAMERAQRRRQARERAAPSLDGRAIWVQSHSSAVRVPLASIDWIEAAKDYVLLHTSTRSYLHRSTMAALETELAGAGLIRVHRSAFIRLDRVVAVHGHGRALSGVTLVNDVEVPVGSTYVDQVIAALQVR